MLEYIKWKEDFNFSQTIELAADGILYTVDILWNSRDNSWYISVFDEKNNPIILNKKLVKNVNVLSNVDISKKPNCVLKLLTDIQKINNSKMTRIGYEEMVNSFCKLYLFNINNISTISTIS